ncbi:6-pyruvoyl trahydropterin synthase family protein [Cohnella soli]|uniref:6-carboxy-5,6,7,8-tetrahydropterin synthase n=1 Tax=Cohnella soli TaxID=425005 RepID=A0ABW0I235_9BACL
MAKVLLYKEAEFSASHRLYNEQLTEAENDTIYSKCAVEHGHNYRLVVGIEGEVDGKTGMVKNVSELNQILKKVVLNKCDHQRLSLLPEFKTIVPTLENLVVWIWGLLEPYLPGQQLKEVILYETDRTFAKYCGLGK